MKKLFVSIIKYAIIGLFIITFLVFHTFNSIASNGTLFNSSIYESDSGYGISRNENVGTEKFWGGWVPIHFGEDIDLRLRPGESAGSNVIYIDRSEGKIVGQEAVKGYGLYQFNLEKHMVGYLYFIKDKINNSHKTDIIKTKGFLFFPDEYYLPREACKYVADLLMSTAYSNDSKNLLHKLLKNIENQNSAKDIKNWQSDYWYKVFGSNAYNLLENIGTNENKFSDIVKGHENDLKGAVLSIMSDRYSNKSLKNKTNLKLNVEKGDLWPFLIYTKTNDNGNTIMWKYDDYKLDSNGKKQEKTTTWDDLIRGAYYYMVYYEYKYDYEGDMVRDTSLLYKAAKTEMFVLEYQELTGKPFIELKGAALDDFYQKVRTVRRLYKKSKDNVSSIFGEEEEYSINSDITYTSAINNIAEKMREEPFKKLFDHTLGDEYIARTYLMAKNIAENERLINQNAQYDIGSNILQRTPGGDDNTILLTDLQKIQLEREDGKFTKDADGDGIIDGKELIKYKQVDITDFVEHLLKAESGLSDVSTLMENYKKNIREANENDFIFIKKRNILETQKDIEVSNDRIVVSLMSYKSNPIMKDTDFDGVWDGFGKDDEVNKNIYNDKQPLDNTIEGMLTLEGGREFHPTTHMDYRYFFMDEYNYYNELAEMSLILSQSIYNRSIEDLTNIDTINEKIRANLIYRHVEVDMEEKKSLNGYDYKTDYVIGNKEVEYSKDNSVNNYIRKTIIPIIIKGMDETSDYRSYSEIGEVDWVKNSRIGEEQHNIKSYEIYAELIKYDIEEYERLNKIKSDYKKVYWITGYKEGGAIANILAAKLRDRGQQVYAYTFGSPMTIYNNPDEPGYTKTGYSARYDCIFNIINEDDPYAYMMPQSLGFSRYGMTCYGDGNKVLNGYIEYKPNKEMREEVLEYVNLIYKGNEKKTRTYTYSGKVYNETVKENGKNVVYKTIKDYIEGFMKYIHMDRKEGEIVAKNQSGMSIITKNLEYFCKLGSKYPIKNLKNKIKLNYPQFKRAGDADVYYIISREMENSNITNIVNLYDKKENKIKGKIATRSYIAMDKALKDMGSWYSNNVYTYNAYSNKDFQRDGNTLTFSGRFQYDYDKASENAKKQRDDRVNVYNGKLFTELLEDKTLTKEYIYQQLYLIEKFIDINSYKTELETFKGHVGSHALYPCELLEDVYYEKYKEVGDDCSAMSLATMYYATRGVMDEYDAIDIHELGGGTLESANEKDILYKNLKEIGFEKIPVKNGTFDELQSGDLLVSSSHYEFYYTTDDSKKTSFGWGSVKDKFPNDKCSIKENKGKNFFLDRNVSTYKYTYIYRLVKKEGYVE